MRVSTRAVRAALLGVGVALTGSASVAQTVPPDVDMLRCAAGYGCDAASLTQCEALAETGLGTANAARDLYALEHSAAYLADARQSTPSECLEAAGSSGGAGPSEDAGAEGSGSSGGGSGAGSGSTDFTQWEGYAETPCPGQRYDDPRFFRMESLAVLACFKGEDASFSECGLAPARAFCLMQGSIDAACYGVTTAPRAGNVDAVCETGACPAFSFIVCR